MRLLLRLFYSLLTPCRRCLDAGGYEGGVGITGEGAERIGVGDVRLSDGEGDGPGFFFHLSLTWALAAVVAQQLVARVLLWLRIELVAAACRTMWISLQLY